MGTMNWFVPQSFIPMIYNYPRDTNQLQSSCSNLCLSPFPANNNQNHGIRFENLRSPSPPPQANYSPSPSIDDSELSPPPQPDEQTAPLYPQLSYSPMNTVEKLQSEPANLSMDEHSDTQSHSISIELKRNSNKILIANEKEEKRRF